MADPNETLSDPGIEAAPPSDTHLSEYWELIKNRKRLILFCLGLALFAGVLATILTRPMYRSMVTVDVVKQQMSPLGFGQSGGGGGDPEFLPSQIQLMQSREIGVRVVKKLNLLANPDFNPKHYKRFLPDAKGKVRVPSQEDLIDAAIDVQGGTDAAIVRGTSLVQITFTHRNPKLAADVANAIAETYIEWNIESRYRIMGQSSEFLSTQIQHAKAELEEKEQALLALGRQKELVSPESQQNPVVAKLDSLTHELDQATSDRVAKEARFNEVRNTSQDVLAEIGSGGLVSQHRADVEKLEREYNDRLNIYKPEWPAMQQLKAQINRERQNYEKLRTDSASKAIEAARTDYLTAMRREESIRGMTHAQRQQAVAQGPDTVEFQNLKIEIDNKRGLLDNLLKQQGETEVISRLRDELITNVRIVDRALPPPEPFKPSLKKNLLIFGFFGMAVGVGLTFLLHYLDRSLRTPQQVEQFLQLPSLGVVPAVGQTGARLYGLRRRKLPLSRRPEPVLAPSKTAIELLPHGDPRSPVAEAYRAFRTSLLLSRAGGVRSVVITSGFPEEGKTSTAVNLAVVLAQLGRRVLLVDADLHKSRIHDIFQLSNSVGLVSILAENMEPSRAILKTSVPGVYVVPAGPETPNPSALLSSEAMQKFMELASTNFDHVIVDTPPVLLVSDMLVFAQQADGVVLCVRGGVTPREEALLARDRILRAGIPVLGVLINALEPDSGSYYHSYRYEYERPREAEEPAAERVLQSS
jgi:capsular exopolysaccharide synthesis family protein